ncbi:MAG: hypothetical protein OXF74_07980 [Rhodobacteraceae bacterium]|nr:hypothetical protein [Paracoccaceae bacterium]
MEKERPVRRVTFGRDLTPSCYPPFSTVQNCFYAWSRSCVLERMLDTLREAARRL